MLRVIGGVLAVASLVAASCSSPSPDASTAQPSGSPVPSESAAPASPSQDGEPSGWQLVGTFGEAGGWDRVIGLARGSGGFLAIGNRVEPTNEVGYSPAGEYLWASTDGTDWEEVPVPEEFAGATLVSVLSAPTGEFIVYANRYDDGTAVWSPVVLTSGDGRGDWTDVDSGLPKELFFTKVIRGSVGYLLLEPQSGDGDPALWFSEDGFTWERTHHFEQVDHWMQVSDIGAGDEGFVAVGVQIELDETTWNRFTFASGDGHAWFETKEPFGPQDPEYRPDAWVAALGPDWIAALPARDDSARFWFSADGLAWGPAGSIDDLPTTQRWAPALFPVGDGVFFSFDANDLPGTPGPWSGYATTDGDVWDALPFDDAAVVRAGASGQGWTVFGGSLTTENGESRAAFWYLPAGES